MKTKPDIPAVIVNFPKGTKFGGKLVPRRVVFIGPDSVKIAKKICAELNQKRKKKRKKAKS